MSDGSHNHANLNLEQFYEDSDEDAWLDASKNEEQDYERFRDPQLIASGGMKDIYKVYDPKTNRHIAMAQLRQDVASEYAEDFLQEAFLTARLEHPNIISVYEIGKDADFNPYFAMELKIGDSLLTILKKRSEGDKQYLKDFPLSKLLDIFLKVCDAISYAHSEGVLHLDVKPDNIQVGKFGEVQLCDWGLGSCIEDIKENKGKVKGTPGYMSPEQSQPDMTKSYQSDIYSLGALLYAILTDKAPGKGGIHTVIRDTINGEIRFPIERFPKKEIPASLDAVVRKAMSVESDERYKNIESLKEEVQKYLTGHSTTAEDAGVLTEAALFYKRNKLVCHVVLFALLMIISGASFFLVKLQESNKETEVALKELTKTYSDLEVARENEKKSFELYKVQNAKQIQLTKDLLKKNFDTAFRKTRNPLFYDKPQLNVKEALLDLQKYYDITKNKNVYSLIGEMNFISQNFAKVIEMDMPDRKKLTLLAKKHVHGKFNANGAISSTDFLKLLKDMNKTLDKSVNQKIMERMIYYNLKLNKRAYAKQEVLIELIKCWNPGWKHSGFNYDREALFLKVHGANLKNLAGSNNESSKQSFLRFIKVNHLSIANSQVDNIRQILGVSTKTLDIRHSKMTSIRGFNLVRNINHLIALEGQLPKEEIRRLPDSIKFEVK